MNAGIDMVHLHARYYQIGDIRNWHQRTTGMVGEERKPWGVSMANQPFLADSYFINRGKSSENTCTITLNPKGLNVQFNPSTYLHPYELTFDVEAVLEGVKKDLDLFEVDTDLDQMTVSRLDITKQAVLDKPFTSFSQALTTIKGKRMKSKQYEGGYSVGNNSRSAIFYDKSNQLQTQKNYTEAPNNLTRCEVRFVRNKTIAHKKRGAGIGRLKDLREATPEYLTESYNRFLNGTVFNMADSHQLAFNFSEEIEILRMYRETYKAPAHRYERTEGIPSIIERFGSLDVYGQMLCEAGYNPKSVYRRIAELKRLAHEKAFLDNRRGEHTVLDVIHELREIYTQTA